MSAIEREIARRIEAFVTELNALLRRSALEAVATALGGSAGGQRSGNGVSRGRGRASLGVGRRKGAKRSPAHIAKTTNSLLDYIKKNPGQRIEQIGKALKIPTKDLTLPAKKLLAGKKIGTKGQKRATTYFPS